MQKVSFGAQEHQPPWSPEPGALGVSLCGLQAPCCHGWVTVGAGSLARGAVLQRDYL